MGKRLGRLRIGLCAAALLGAAPGLLGCPLTRLAGDLERIKTMALITGRVRGIAPDKGPVYVVVRCETDGGVKRVRVEKLVAPVSLYGVFVPPLAPCWIAAFQDRDGDTRWGEGEPFGLLLSGQALTLAQEEQRTATDLPLGEKGDLDGWTRGDLDLTNERIPPPLPISRGDLTTLENPIFDPERAREGLWTPLTSAKRTGFGVYLLEPYDPARTPVLFVHGMRGTPRDFRMLIDTLDRKHYEPWVAYYPSGLRLDITVHVMRDILVELAERYKVKSVVLVAHSVGGLVSRSLLLDLARDGRADLIRAFITFSTPFGGQPNAQTGINLAPQAVPSWLDIAPGSELLASLRNPGPRTVPFHLFFSYGSRSALVGANNDGAVTVPSQLARYAQSEAVRLYGYPVEHTEILSAEDPVKDFQALLAEL